MKGSLNTWLLVVVAVCALSFWFGRGLVLPERVTEAASRLDRGRRVPVELPPVTDEIEPVHLVILNGTPTAGLAREFGLLLGQAGCVAEQLGNAPHDRFERSFLVNRRLPEARAARLAARLGGVAVLQEFDGRLAADAVLILGGDAAGVREALLRRNRS